MNTSGLKDYQRWLKWYHENVDPNLGAGHAMIAYDRHYFCRCPGCEYAKEHGQIPFAVHPQCQLTPDHGQIDSAEKVARLLAEVA